MQTHFSYRNCKQIHTLSLLTAYSLPPVVSVGYLLRVKVETNITACSVHEIDSDKLVGRLARPLISFK